MATKKDDEDALTAAQKKALRTGRSFFPAANMATQGQVLIPAGGSLGGRALPPEQNPAYQTAIAKGRPARSGYEFIQTPSGGSMAVPIGQKGKYTDLLYKNNPVTNTGFQRPDTQAAYNLGFQGGPAVGNTAYARSYNLGFQGDAVQRPPSAGLGYQVGSAIANFSPTAVGQGIANTASRIGGFFGFGQSQRPSGFGGGSTNAAIPSPTPYATPVASPTPTPYKTTDARSDLLRDTEGTFYGGGQAPIPTPTPTPYAPRLAQPRRYFDYGYA